MSAGRKTRPVYGRRFLPLDTAQTLLSVAVGPYFGYPVCDELAASHAAGVSTACVVARAMRANIGFLQDQVEVCRGELLLESDFTLDKLYYHMDNVFSLNAMVFFVTADRALLSADRQNIVTRAFGVLPPDVLQAYNEGVLRIRDILDDEILWPMIELADRIRESEDSNGGTEVPDDEMGDRQGSPWEDAIRSLLHHQAPTSLAEVYRRLGEVGLHVGGIAENVKADWECDLNQISGPGGCSRDRESDKKEPD